MEILTQFAVARGRYYEICGDESADRNLSAKYLKALSVMKQKFQHQ